ncbi:oligopeptidase F. Metallo peptidase. MEROPS family M03B [Pelagirhabdus alkalitolerans]|uniref:Oligopeptidase F n=1 Tax=Pelagirhabdus alkalitolerans TaxID=1612202 RepID=A0A1G6KDA5_9BACI|nr:oligoendopeptidase F [Pelagirhabdus alkalitolerans]SDC29059.1 oligopeptidase F. Metallo peptidase. MEROPS family M03B [Pelagirhabdus alkalitolerans]
MSQQLKKREEIEQDKKWRLEDIFENDEVWEKERQHIKEMLEKFKKFQGRISDSPESLYELLKLEDHVAERFGKLYTYAHMRYDQDTTNSFYQTLNTKAQSLYANVAQALSFIVPEILQIDPKEIDRFMDQLPELKHYEKALEDILRKRDHVRDEKEEALLAQLSEVTNQASQTFGVLNNADLTFPPVKNDEGEEVELTHGRYINFMEATKQSVREEAFHAMYDTYEQFINTFAQTLSQQVKKDNVYANIRNYTSAREAALKPNNIPETVYDHLIEAVHSRLHILHRYIKLRKKVLDLDELHMYDLYTPLIKDVDMRYKYEEAQEILTKALAPLGDEYVSRLEEGFSNRWVDVEENKGKRSGAYSSGAYGTNPYILMNWQNNLNNVFTLAHEFGHSLHSYYTRENQPFRYGDYSIFVAEVASTCNEALLNDYLINNTEDKREKLFLINHFLDGFRGTVFRQTMFAEFEHLIHQLDQSGEVLTPERLTKEYYALNQMYYGEGVIHDEQIGLEWARIPHFYYNYYVYQYATGYAAAQSLAASILNKESDAKTRYFDFLKAGSRYDPIDVLKQAGVDMTEQKPVLDALDVFEAKLNEMEQLFNELN